MKNNILNFETWLRLFYSVFYGFVLCLTTYVLFAIVLIQFVVMFIKGEPCPKLTKFGGQLSTFIAKAIAFVTFKRDDKPFPFADWPKE